MKKLLCVLLSLALLCAILPACEEKEPEKLRVCFDVGIAQDLTIASNGGSAQEEAVKAFLNYLDDCGSFREGITSEDIELELIPSDESQSTQRETALQRVRTEIMTGSGPDVFVCKADTVDFLYQERLFPYVEKAIQDGLFLPLDDYMERAVLTNFSDLCAPILEGGKDQNGRQVVLPMAYTIGVDVYWAEDLSSYDAAGKTWEEVLTGDDPILAAQAGWMFGLEDRREEDGDFFTSHRSSIPCIFPNLVDFKTGSLTVTEEELAGRIKEALAAYRRYLEQEGRPERMARKLWPAISAVIGSKEAAFVPLRNETGGTTAEVAMYCAVNKNTKQPERAFEVVDALLSEYPQQGSNLYKNTYGGIPVNKNILSPELPFDKTFHIGFTQQQYEEYQKAIDQIDAVSFPSLLDAQLTGHPESLFEDLQKELLASFDHGEGISSGSPEIFRKGSISDERLAEIVHTYYQKMERLLDES